MAQARDESAASEHAPSSASIDPRTREVTAHATGAGEEVSSRPARAGDGPAEIPDLERALLSCLLRLDAASALKVAGLVRPDDLASPALAELLAAVAALTHLRIDPEPTAVLALLRDDGRANGTRVQAVAQLLHDLYASAAVPVSARFYAAAVLKEATRRRAREAGERIAQAAELVPIDALPELVERELLAVQALAERAAGVGS